MKRKDSQQVGVVHFPVPGLWPATIFKDAVKGDTIRFNTPYGRFVLEYV